MRKIIQSNSLAAVIAAQQTCTNLTDQVTKLDEMLDHLDGILEQVYMTPGLSFSVKASLNAAIVEYGKIADAEAKIDLSRLEGLLDELRRAVEQSG